MALLISPALLLLAFVVVGEAKLVYDFKPVKCGFGWKSREVVAKLNVRNKQECFSWCKKLDSCKSFQVQRPEKIQCTILLRTAGEAGFYVMPKKGFTYKEKTTPISHNSPTCSKMPPKCNPMIDTFEEVEVVAERGNTWGWWGRDAFRTVEEDSRYFWVDAYSNQHTVYWYESLEAVWADRTRHSFSLPFGCDGSQILIYDGKFYCRRYNDRKVVVYDIDKYSMVTLISFDNVEGWVAGYGGQCSWNWGGRSDIDMAADETGVYAIWGVQPDSCKMVVSKINTETYEIEKNWRVNVRKSDEGQAFLLCGRLYIIDHYHNNPGYIMAVYDLRTHNLTHYRTHINRDYIYWPNEHGYLASAHYNPVDGYIYTWNNIRFGRKKPHYVDRTYEEVMWMNI